MDSTTLKVSVAGHVVYLACRRQESFLLGSSESCKFSIDGEDIAPEHCEIQRGEGVDFVVRSMGGERLTVIGADPLFPDEGARRLTLGDGFAEEAWVGSSFVLEIGTFEFEASLVDDSEGAIFAKDTYHEEDNSPASLIGYRSGGDSSSDSVDLHARNDLPNHLSSNPLFPACRTSEIVFTCAIPALRFGAFSATSTCPDISTEGPCRPSSGFDRIHSPRSDVSAPRLGSVEQAFEVPSVFFLFAVILISLTSVSGYGWFEWREFTLPKNPVLLRAKIAKGDTFAMATLGLSLVRGEWGVKLDAPKGVRLIEDSASAGDPLGLLALGLLQRDGYETSVHEAPGAELSRGDAAWRLAFQSGLEERVGRINDARWWTLTGRAVLAVKGRDADDSKGWLQRADRRHYPEAASLLGELSSNEADRANWFRRADENARSAARLGSVFAHRLLGELHRKEAYAGRDPYFGAEEIKIAAESGEANAQFLLGDLLDERGNEEEAFVWFERAAQAGHLPAKVELSGRYLTGVGIPAQPRLALSLAEEAGAAGERSAFRVLAKAYAEGIGVVQDTQRAIQLLNDLADLGDIRAAVDLGRILAEIGRSEEAIPLLRRAAEAGDVDSAFILGRILSTQSDEASISEAIVWLEKALSEGRSEATIHLADALDHPDRNHRDPSRAILLLERLADAGDHLCGLRLSRYLLEGRGCTPDPTKAFLLVKKAADAGVKSAFFTLGELYESGAGNISPSPTSALLAYRKAIESGDERVQQRFPGLRDAPSVAVSFVKSWGSPEHHDTLRFLADSVDSYFHLDKPDAARIASLESGFRQLWKQREVKTGVVDAVSMEALDHIRLEIPLEITLARDTWELGGTGRATVDLRLMSGGEWRIFRFAEVIKEWQFSPGQANFAFGQESVTNSRSVFPTLTPEQATYDIANLPVGLIDQVKSAPLSDKFGRSLVLLPTSLADDVIAFSRITTGGEVLMPVSHFDTSVIERIETLTSLQSFGFYEELFDGLIDLPNPADPTAAALLKLAEQGDHEAAALLGEQFYDGLGSFPVNRVEALKWFVQSARAKHPLGRLWIAVMTARGEIAASSPARDLFRDVLPDLAPIIARSEAKAPYWRATGECFSGGEEVSLGERQPRELLDRASQRGDLRAKLLLGETLLETNPIEGIRYLRNASDGGCATASTSLAKYYLGPGNDKRLVWDLLRVAACKNDIEAQILLGIHLAPTNPAESAFWLKLSLHHSIQFAAKDLEMAARRAERELKMTVGEDHFRRAANFLAKKKKSLGQ